MKYMQQSKNNLKPQDVVILLKIIALGEKSWFHHTIAQELGISQSEVSQSLNRSKYAGLIDDTRKKVNKLAFTEFLLHGVAYAFPEAAEACKSLWSATAKECRANGIDLGAEQNFFKVIYGMETCLLRPTPESRDKGGYSIVLLVQNEIGKRNLYHLITDCSGAFSL